MTKALNLYAGIGGNRKLWTSVDVTAVEIDPKIAEIYRDFFPSDKVIVADAHEYLLHHYKEFDFIWSSPPCPTHSDIRRCGVHKGQYDALYPDMGLYQEIILLKNFAPKNTKWVIENVKPYYNYLIEPDMFLDRHPFWSNFYLERFCKTNNRKHNDIIGSEQLYGFSIKNYNHNNKRAILRNMVDPELGLHIFNIAMKRINEKQKEQLELFSV